MHANVPLSWPSGISSIWSGSPGPSGSWALCVSAAHRCAPWLPGHLQYLPLWSSSLILTYAHTLTHALLLDAGATMVKTVVIWCWTSILLSPAYRWPAPFSPSYPYVIPNMFFSKPSCSLLLPHTIPQLNIPLLSPVQCKNTVRPRAGESSLFYLITEVSSALLCVDGNKSAI